MKSLSLTQPHMIVMVGVPGSGKTFFADKFAETFHGPYISLDKLTTLTRASAPTLKALVDHQLHELLKTHQSIIIEGVSDTKAERLALSRRAHEAGYETLFVWVQIDPATAKQRAVKQAKQLRDQSDSSADYDRRTKRFTAPTPLEKSIVISGKHTYATQAKIVLKKLSAPRAEISTHDTPPIRPVRSGRHNITVR
jgi:predicted kinase